MRRLLLWEALVDERFVNSPTLDEGNDVNVAVVDIPSQRNDVIILERSQYVTKFSIFLG